MLPAPPSAHAVGHGPECPAGRLSELFTFEFVSEFRIYLNNYESVDVSG